MIPLEKLVLNVSPDVAEFDEWIRSMRLLVSQIGFALDNYLARRPSAQENGRPT